MIQREVKISTGAAKDISALATGLGREAVALAALSEAITQGSLSLVQIASLHELAERAEMCVAKKVNDHTFTYRVAGPTSVQTQESYIHEKLGSHAQLLIDELKRIGVDVSVNVPGLSEATLDTGSNEKTRKVQTQLYEGGLADPLQATNIAIAAFCKARKVGLDFNDESPKDKGRRIKAAALKAGLDEGTATVIEKLTAGFIKAGSANWWSETCSLRISARGYLEVGSHTVDLTSRCWVFAARPDPESNAIAALRGDAQPSRKKGPPTTKALETTPHTNDFAEKVNDHTFTYRVAGPTSVQTQESYIHEKLGSHAQLLIDELKRIGVDVSVNVPGLSEATLDTGSNEKTHKLQRPFCKEEFANLVQATNIAIAAFCEARKVGLNFNDESREDKGRRIKAAALKAGLDEGTATVLEKLTAGSIRIGGGAGSGSLCIVDGSGMERVTDGGRLRASDYYGRGSKTDAWAFGARPAPESKN